MLRDRLREGALAGLIGAAATAGALIGFGVARGAAWRPINTIAHLVIGYRAEITDGFDPLVTLLGLGVHVASLVAWGVLFSLLAARLRGVRLLLAALLFAAGAFALDHLLLPVRLKPGFELVLSWPELVALYAVLALALAAGLATSRGARGDAGGELRGLA
ncbi:MAG TPA: hypothetical protein VFS05_16675 [Gemmatimonadaceae bacterium]|nr:hypothetical protein [Gemmatimonadaceae bacterium]